MTSLPSKPCSQPDESSTQLSEPSSQPSEPSSQRSEPSSQPGEPSSQPDEPSSQPGEPSSQSGEPSNQSGEPSNQSGEPSTQADGESQNLQEVSVQWLDFKKIGRHLGLEKDEVSKLSTMKAIEGIVSKYNADLMKQKKEIEIPMYELQTGPPADQVYPYQQKMYTISTNIISNFAKLDTQRKADITSQRIIFLYRDRIIFALTSNHAFEIVKSCVDFSFPMKVVRRIGNPKKVGALERRRLFGECIKEVKHFETKYEYECEALSNLYCLVESFTCEIKRNSSLAQELPPPKKTPTKPQAIDFDVSRFLELLVVPSEEIEAHTQRPLEPLSSQNEVGGICNITVRASGMLRIRRRLDISDYPNILDLFVKYMRGERTNYRGTSNEEIDDPSFSFLDLISLTNRSTKTLNILLIKEIFQQYRENQRTEFYVRHKYLIDYLSSNTFEIRIFNQSRYRKIADGLPTVEEIIKEINEKDETKFSEKFFKSSLRYDKGRKKSKPVPLIDCIEGALRDKEEVYYKIRNCWYNLKVDYIAHLNCLFKNLIKTKSIRRNAEGFLPHPWLKNVTDEKYYNRAYLSPPYGAENKYLVFDRMFTSTTTEPVEFCDILKYNDDKVYLYHVKDEFGNKTREVSSQILCAAKLVRSSLSVEQPENYLERIWRHATREAPKEKKVRTGKKTKETDARKEKAKEETRQFNAAVKEAVQKCFPTPSDFINLFYRREIVFVCAFRNYISDNEEKSIFEELEKHYITSEALTCVENPAHRRELFDQLVEAGYLNTLGDVTGKFCYTNKKEFKLKGRFSNRSICNDIYSFLTYYKPSSLSVIGRLELLQVARDLKKLDCDFRIYEIDKVKQGG